MWYGDIAAINLTGANLPRDKTKTRNFEAYWLWFTRLMNLVLSAFKVTGDSIPDTIDKRTIKQSIFFYDSFSIFRVNNVDLSLPALPAGDLTIYGYPRTANVFSRNGFIAGEQTPKIHVLSPNGNDIIVSQGAGGELLPASGVMGAGYIIRAHEAFMPLVRYTAEYAWKISDTIRTIEVMSVKMKNPYIIFCAEEMRKTVERYFQQIRNNDDLVITTGIFDPNKVVIQQTEINPESIKAAKELVEWYLSQFVEMIGINSNPAPDKGERLITAEANSNNELIDLNIDPMIDYMNEQLETAADFFGWDMKIERSVKKDERDPIPGIPGNFGDVPSGSDMAGERDSSGSESD